MTIAFLLVLGFISLAVLRSYRGGMARDDRRTRRAYDSGIKLKV
jgi:hypothetical protein